MTTFKELDDPKFGDFYDKDGTKITMRQWMDLKEDARYTFVARSKAGHYLISTVWIGIDMGWEGIPLIFETMVFDANTSDGDYMDTIRSMKYATEHKALAGHQKMCEQMEQQYKQEEGNHE